MSSGHQDELRVPLLEEQLSIEKRQVETERVRVHTLVDVEHATVEETLRGDRLEVTRVAVERAVAEAPAPYQDGDTLVIPVIEERLVIEKRLFVVEEVRVTRSSHDEATSIPVSLRRMRAVVERDDLDPPATGNI